MEVKPCPKILWANFMVSQVEFEKKKAKSSQLDIINLHTFMPPSNFRY